MPRKLTEEEKKAKMQLEKERARRRKKREEAKLSKEWGERMARLIPEIDWWFAFGKGSKFRDRLIEGEYSPKTMENVWNMIGWAEALVDTKNNYASWFWDTGVGRQHLKIVERERATGKFVKMLYMADDGLAILSMDDGLDSFRQQAQEQGVRAKEVEPLVLYAKVNMLDDDDLHIRKTLREVPA